MVDLASARFCKIVGEKLERDHGGQRGNVAGAGGKADNVLCEFADAVIVSGHHRPQPGQAANICAMLRIDGQGSDLAENPPPMQEAPRAAEEREDADKDTEIGFFRSARARIAALVAVAVLMLAAVGGLVLTIVYAVRDSLYDASATVWIIAIPQNTPMLVLSVFLAVFIAMLVALFVILLRGKRK